MSGQDTTDRRGLAAPLKRQAAVALATGFLATLAIAMGLGAWLNAPAASAVLSLGLYLAGAGLLWLELPRHRPHERFGSANRITLLRGCMILALAGLILAPQTVMAAPWLPLAFAGAALVLDGIDGRAARRENLVSDFGAWFDQELDGLFILVLSVLAWQSEQVGPWVLAAGLYRYLFLVLEWALPWLREPLPYSGRRRVVCAYTAGALILCLVPMLPKVLTLTTAASACLLITLSFAVDIWWLMQKHGETL